MLNTTASRLEGLDLARCLSFFGMVIVNFKIAMGANDDCGWTGVLTGSIEGKAAATFVVVAGIGLGLAAKRVDHTTALTITLKRAAFLLVIGLMNSLVFDADILHYYACYFLFGGLLMPLSSRWLVAIIALLNGAFLAMILFLNYDTGWNWDNYTYANFWTPRGFIRNLFFNGWHPVIPWLSFLLLGIILSRLQLSDAKTQRRLAVVGVTLWMTAEAISYQLSIWLAMVDPELTVLATTKPVPPMTLYMLSGCGAALILVGICLRFNHWFAKTGVLRVLTPTGQQTLTLYIAHILVGMGTLESCGMLKDQTIHSAMIASALFCTLAVVYAFLWSRFFKRGPIEAAMRKIAG